MSHMVHEQSTAGCPTSACPTCAPQTPLRNHYFFGKLMDVPDFDVEQQYVVEKLKRHHQRLHGTGVICGLEVTAHANPACRDRYVVIKPGAALDCCGNEILVLNEETLDIQAFPEIAKLIQAVADGEKATDHVLQFCVRYRECPTEDVPVLYDECGCDDTRCAPNRILESYAFDVLVDPDLSVPAAPFTPHLEWVSTLFLPGAKAVLVHEGTERIYVAADLGSSGGIVQQFHLRTGKPVAPKTFDHRVRALAANADGSHLFVGGGGSQDGATLDVVDTTTPEAFSSESSWASVTISDYGADVDYLLILPSDELVSSARISHSDSVVQLWKATATPPTAISGRSARIQAVLYCSPVVASDGTTLFAADFNGGRIFHFDSTRNGLEPLSLEVSEKPKCIEVVKSTGPDVLAVLDPADNNLFLTNPENGKVLGKITLPEPPFALAIDPGGRFAYVLMQPATGPAQVICVDLHRVLADPTHPELALGTVLPIGAHGVALALAGGHLYAAYEDGVAVLAIHDADCGDYLNRRTCPSCDTGDCVVLATVQGWRPGRGLENPTVPPDPAADAAAEIARIDNDLDRVVVPSVTDLAKAVACILDQGVGGGKGEQGPPGDPGTPGLGIDKVEAFFIDCDESPEKPVLVTEFDSSRTLQLQIPRGCDGAPGLDWNLPHICDFNWAHGGTIKSSELMQGLVVSFDTEIFKADLSSSSIRVQGAVPFAWGNLDVAFNWSDLAYTLHHGNLKPSSCDTTNSTFEKVGKDQHWVGAFRVFLPPTLLQQASTAFGLHIRVLINGDLIRGRHKNDSMRLCALDADHLPKIDSAMPPNDPNLGSNDPDWMHAGDSRLSGDGIEGGTFESWFRVIDDGNDEKTNLTVERDAQANPHRESLP